MSLEYCNGKVTTGSGELSEEVEWCDVWGGREGRWVRWRCKMCGRWKGEMCEELERWAVREMCEEVERWDVWGGRPFPMTIVSTIVCFLHHPQISLSTSPCNPSTLLPPTPCTSPHLHTPPHTSYTLYLPTPHQDGGNVEVWSLESRQLLQTVRGPAKGVTSLVLRDDHLYCGDVAGMVQICGGLTLLLWRRRRALGGPGSTYKGCIEQH